ncbi:MAG: imidazole glycerol phosphate synthase subunit HisH [Hyphomicrobiaceae bacterium]
MQRIAIIDYGSGNLHSAQKAVMRAGEEANLEIAVSVTADAAEVAAADRIILPGVGAFADCRSGLAAVPGMIAAIEQAVMVKRRPFLGICVGMQLLATRGLEFGSTAGLDWIAGDVTAIEPGNPSLKIPHMGWNTLDRARDHALLDGIALGDQGLHAYFVHSYHLVPVDRSAVIAECRYGSPIIAMVGKDNIVGTQFHPEKSQKLGLRLLRNFLSWDV